MEAIGRLAGGIAHDFNNLLSVVMSYSSLLISDLCPGDPMRADLQEIQTAGERAQNLTRQLLTFSRQEVVQPETLDLNQVIAGMDRMLRRLIREDVELITVPGANLGTIWADRGQLEQIVMNLVLNARDAISDGGRITIETARAEVEAGFAHEHVGITPGSFVVLTIADTGLGMDSATRARIFEPFFTTKGNGRGTGLGLSTVSGIVQQCGGSIWVDSEPGKGSVFRIYLPEAQKALPLEAAPSVPEAALRGTETILLVEDEDQVRSLAREILRRNGYRVLEARSAGEALLISEQYPNDIQLLLTDVVMPQMSGRQLANRIRSQRAAMKVLLMSGYGDDALPEGKSTGPGLALIAKPLTPCGLSHKIREVLDSTVGPV
jgi:CheY-like chemotaxis protein